MNIIHDILVLGVIRFFGESRESYLVKLRLSHLSLCVEMFVCSFFFFQYIMFDDVRHGYFRDWSM